VDHARVNVNSSYISCGVRELSRLSDDAKENLFAIANALYHPAHSQPCAFIIWSNVDDRRTNGHNLKTLIDELSVGAVYKTASAINPNTGNPICIWTWMVNHEALRKWYFERRLEKLKTKAD
jgi:hypothetical protein